MSQEVDDLASDLLLEEFDSLTVTGEQSFNFVLGENSIQAVKTRKNYNNHNMALKDFALENPDVNLQDLQVGWLKDYFQFLHQNKKVTGQTLWQYHSSLAKLYACNYNLSIKNVANYSVLSSFIKELEKNSVDSTAGAEDIPLSTVIGVLSQYPEDGSNIMKKAFFVFTTISCKRCDDAHCLQFHHLTFKEDSIDFDISQTATNPTSKKTKTDACTGCIVKSNVLEICPFRIFKKYTDQIEDKKGPVFRRWVGKKGGGYFGKQAVGINTMYSFFQDILKSVIEVCPEDIQIEERTGARAPEHLRSNKTSTKIGLARYTGHTGRKTAGTIISTIAAMTDLERKKYGDWKNMKTVETYSNNNPETRKIASKKVVDHLSDAFKRSNDEEEESQYAPVAKKSKSSESSFSNDGKTFVFKNCSNITINF
ncbi:predicted protein [Naegleria gruberi]|uniref:Predicted protein n=1 Tax=Naegleria gruberi TaxID=5762 RepID=D2VI03_NAEGR|nr:uncharacterized protein NAEGRDRAFT_49698 [Naegleria gruberi]EFC43432.1 predicted protein [Naegleria gruberi]|eukprot:XP_002676176.1 predicted protein [Naegleria gruberi strain NEG-M]